MKKLLLLCAIVSGAAYGMSGPSATSSTAAKAPEIASPASMDEQLFQASLTNAQEAKRLADLTERRLEIDELALAVQILKLTEDDVSGNTIAGSGTSRTVTTYARCKLCGAAMLLAMATEVQYPKDGAEKFYRHCRSCNGKNPVNTLEDVQKSAALLIMNYKFRTANKK